MAGPPGTGKTLAARVVANTLGRRLYAANIDQIVSKWMGETEKHIHSLFDAASGTGAVLLFDEADSLFTSRVEASSSQDQHGNQRTNLLLQEIEAYEGIVLLTSNLERNIDPAFARRILFHVEFELPDADLRAQIWRVVLPPETPVDADVDFDALADDFEMSGGEIKNALLRGAIRAHAAGVILNQATLREACAREYRRSGKLVRERVQDDF